MSIKLLQEQFKLTYNFDLITLSKICLNVLESVSPDNLLANLLFLDLSNDPNNEKEYEIDLFNQLSEEETDTIKNTYIESGLKILSDLKQLHGSDLNLFLKEIKICVDNLKDNEYLNTTLDLDRNILINVIIPALKDSAVSLYEDLSKLHRDIDTVDICNIDIEESKSMLISLSILGNVKIFRSLEKSVMDICDIYPETLIKIQEINNDACMKNVSDNTYQLLQNISNK